MRGKRASKRMIEGDPKYGSVVVAKFINYVMQDGKKILARKFVYESLEEAAKKVDKKPLELLEESLKNVMPSIEVRSRRVGGANYQVPVPVTEARQLSLALRWIIDSARKKKGKAFGEFLSQELIDAYKGEGSAVKKREDVEKMAEANKAFAHFRW